MQRKAHISLNESIMRVAKGGTNITNPDSHKNIIDSFIEGVFAGVDLNEHTEESMVDILREAIEGVFMLKEGLTGIFGPQGLIGRTIKPEPISYNTLMNNASNPDPKIALSSLNHENTDSHIIDLVSAHINSNVAIAALNHPKSDHQTLYYASTKHPNEDVRNHAKNQLIARHSEFTRDFLNMTAPETNEETSSSNIIEAQYKSRFARIGSGSSPTPVGWHGSSQVSYPLPAAGSSTLGDFSISKKDSEELKTLAIAHHESGTIGEHDPESLEGQEQIERGKALVRKIREVANQNPDDPASDQRTAIVRRMVDNHIRDHVAAKNYDEDAYMRDAERESGFGVGGMSASQAERMGW